MPAALSLRAIALALLTVTIWGSNFVAIKLALHDLPPLLLCALRFVFVSLPLVIFLPRPAISWGQLVTYGLTMFGLQFSFMFLGMKLGLSAGLASVVLQFQVFVTLALSVTLLRERLAWPQIAGGALAIAGFTVIGLHLGHGGSITGMICVLLAAVSWGYANVFSRRLGRVNPLALVAWGGLVVPLPMLLASLIFEGPATIAHAVTHVGWPAIFSLAYIVYVSTHIGYSLWSWLLARHPASAITPFALLVPVVGMVSSAFFLGEELPGWKLQAAALVLAGLGLNILAPRLAPARAPAPRP